MVTEVLLGALVAGLAWFLNWIYFRPRRLQKHLRQQGFSGSSYKLFYGDTKLITKMVNGALSKPISLDSDITSRVVPATRHFIHIHGKSSFIWHGPVPRIIITDPKMVREILVDYNTFQKNFSYVVAKIFPGITSLDGGEWAKRRRALHPAFHLEKLKQMFPTFREGCSEMMKTWEMLVDQNGSSEIDVWPYFQNLAGDIISRTAFGSNLEEGRMIFQLQKEQADILTKQFWAFKIPGWRFLPIDTNNKINQLNKKINSCVREIVEKKKNTLKAGESTSDDLLGIMLGSQKTSLDIDEVVKECKLFYFAGAETTSAFVTWLMILLSRHQKWQTRAREEVFDVFGRNTPDFDGLSRLKVVTMIMNETLRLYPPIVETVRKLCKATKIGELWMPGGVELGLSIMLIHYDTEIWGDDAKEFNPERFSEGVAKVTNSEMAFLPFGQGPRICIGQNFAMMEVKLAMSMILQHFYFELSPSYAHAPYNNITLQPQHGAQIILHKI